MALYANSHTKMRPRSFSCNTILSVNNYVKDSAADTIICLIMTTVSFTVRNESST